MCTWIVRGFIVESKGININWAKANESKTKEKACRDEVKGNGLLGAMKRKQTINISNSGGNMIPNGKVRVSQLAPQNPELEDASFAPSLEDDMGQSFYTMSKCPNGVSIEDIQKDSEFLYLKKELCILCKSKIKSLKVDENIASNKLLSIKYNFQDRKTVVEEA
jgi:hypothetical protein